MSKYRIGAYNDGTPKYSYFRRHKHHLKTKTIRYYAYLSKAWCLDYGLRKILNTKQ
jgi:hypothetical protein